MNPRISLCLLLTAALWSAGCGDDTSTTPITDVSDADVDANGRGDVDADGELDSDPDGELDQGSDPDTTDQTTDGDDDAPDEDAGDWGDGSDGTDGDDGPDGDADGDDDGPDGDADAPDEDAGDLDDGDDGDDGPDGDADADPDGDADAGPDGDADADPDGDTTPDTPDLSSFTIHTPTAQVTGPGAGGNGFCEGAQVLTQDNMGSYFWAGSATTTTAIAGTQITSCQVIDFGEIYQPDLVCVRWRAMTDDPYDCELTDPSADCGGNDLMMLGYDTVNDSDPMLLDTYEPPAGAGEWGVSCGSPGTPDVRHVYVCRMNCNGGNSYNLEADVVTLRVPD